jgi:hypothetical protein
MSNASRKPTVLEDFGDQVGGRGLDRHGAATISGRANLMDAGLIEHHDVVGAFGAVNMHWCTPKTRQRIVVAGSR